MKRSKKIIILLILLLGAVCRYSAVNADSGWDSDYDSGGWNSDYDSGGWNSDYDSGGWNSDSSWDNDYSYDSSSSHGHSSSNWSFKEKLYTAIFILISCLLPFAIAHFSVKSTNRQQYRKYKKYEKYWRKDNNSNKYIYIDENYNSSNKYIDINESEILAVDPNLNIEDFKTYAFNTYRDIQTAWMNFDTDTIRKLTTDEIYNMYSSQLKALKLKGQKNIMKDIILEDIRVVGIKKVNNVIIVDVYMRVKCYDYVIKEEPFTVVRGRDKQKIIIEYVLSFVKSSVNNETEEKCPNCGATLEINSSATCPYCDSTLVKESSDYVMSKKTCVGQSLER